MTTERLLDISHPCWTGDGDELDHDWHYEGGDPPTGHNAGWVCWGCDETKDGDPPDDDY